MENDPMQPDGERAISKINNAIEKIVITDMLRDGDLGWARSRVFRPQDLKIEIDKLKQADGKDIIVFGSHQLWNELLTQGLVDELHILIGPGAVGAGVPAFETGLPTKLKLLETRKLDDADVVLLAYAVS